MLENPIYSSLTDTLFNISQLHNNMHVQINMNFTKKLDMDYKMSKNAFNMYYETTSFLPSFLHCSEYSEKKKNVYVAVKKPSFLFGDVIYQTVSANHLVTDETGLCCPWLEF